MTQWFRGNAQQRKSGDKLSRWHLLERVEPWGICVSVKGCIGFCQADTAIIADKPNDDHPICSVCLRKAGK